jgi:uncharacterized protein YybS (DUF2232 family)
VRSVLGTPAGRRPTRGLTEGAILAALSAVAAAIGLVAPFVGVLLAPIPVMLLVIRWGLRTAVLAAVVAGLILLQFVGPLNALSITGVFAPLGLALGWGVRRRIGAQLTVLAGATAFLASSIAAVGLTMTVLHQDVLGQFIQTQVQGMQMAVSLQQRLGAPPQQVEQLRALVEATCGEHHCDPAAFPQLIRTLLPVMLALGALLWAYLCYTLARSVLRRIGHEIPGVPAILTWRLSAPLAAAMLWTFSALSVASHWVAALNGAVWNAMILTLFVFGFQGALVGITWMNTRQIPRIAQILVLLLLFTAGLLPQLALAMVGILDTWYDYRHLARSPKSEDPGTRAETSPPPAKTPPQAKAAHPQ